MTRTCIYNHEDVVTAMCIWEEIQDRIRRSKPGDRWWRLMDNCGGACATRDWVVDELLLAVNVGYELASSRGFDEPFDWEFVPRFLDKAIGENGNLVEEWIEVAKRIGEERQ